ncbi:MAG: Asp-tRNA(Asn)/Glu-tRNA(Gln) amidotransferase subunit GatA [Proteobacteria bacterium]|nr:Asp-tRNA(Asn)/Glu-tRNA(Gln) amidotransferase subunit GatA [Pseudomonadota bacterium]
MTENELLLNGTIGQILSAVKGGNITVEGTVRFFIERIKKNNLNTFIEIYEEEAVKKAREADRKVAAGDVRGAFFGIPFALKDNIAVKGHKLTCASNMLRDYTATYNSTVYEKIEAEGGILIGRTNMDEFAMGSSTETSFYGSTLNPWDRNRVPGGSSGGSAAAVAAREVVFALGSDTGGSIRQPAAFCGVTGLKPTYGRVSRYGLVAFASSLDQIGPICRSAEDAERVFSVINGFDKKDTTSKEVEKYDFTDYSPKKFKVAVSNDLNDTNLNPDIKLSLSNLLNDIKRDGHNVEGVDFDFSKYSVPVYQILSCSEASSNLARYDGIRYGYRTEKYDSLFDMYKKTRGEGFGEEVKRRILFGTYILMAKNSALYASSFKVARLIRDKLKGTFEKYDILITPTTFNPAFKFGEKIDDPIQMHHSDALTSICNLSGNPGISIPAGFSREGLPIGLQIITKRFDEKTMFQFAKYLQSKSNWHRALPEE